jgi:hypothetical protein
MPKGLRELAIGFVALAALGFLGGIVTAAYYTLWVEGAPRPGDMPAFVAETVTSIGAILGTNLGAALGIRATTQQWRLSPASDTMDGLRVGAAWFYAGCLVLALAFWGFTGFTEEAGSVVPMLPQFSRTLLGVVVGVVAVLLGVPRQETRQKDGA